MSNTENIFCERCYRAVNSTWGGLCNVCQDADRKHREMVSAQYNKAGLEAECARLRKEVDYLRTAQTAHEACLKLCDEEAEERGAREMAELIVRTGPHFDPNESVEFSVEVDGFMQLWREGRGE